MKEISQQNIKDGFAVTAIAALTTLVVKLAVERVAAPFVEEKLLTEQEQIELDYKDTIAWACVTGIAGAFLALALKKYQISVKGNII